MVVIDQTEAKYDVSEVFFVTKADENPPPFKLGDNAFWKQAGCNWKQQLKYYENIQKTIATRKKKQWKKIADKRIKEDERENKKKEEMQEDENEGKLPTNNPRLGPPEIQEAYDFEIKKQLGLDQGSHYEHAHKKLGSIFEYIPGHNKGFVFSEKSW